MKQATRDAILAAAEAVFARRGVAAARMEEIADEAGVAVGTLYNYFDDRSALLSEVLQSAAREIAGRLDAELPPPGDPAGAQLRAFVRLVASHVEAHLPLFATLVEEEVASGRVGAGGAPRRPPVLRAVFERARAIVEAGVAQGALRPEDAALYPALLMGMLRGLVTHRLFGGDGARMDALVEPLLRTFLDGAGTGGDRR